VGRNADIVDLLQRETEGNVFFLIEVVRALAEEAGDLDRILQMTLPTNILTGGSRQLVERRLNRVKKSAHPLLRIAAAAGRQLDLAVLQTVLQNVLQTPDPATDLEFWLADCADAGILNVVNNEWQFAHDKFRDGLLSDVTPNALADMHHQIASAIEQTYADTADYAVSLAYHWGASGDRRKESMYTAIAGEQALRFGANAEAVSLLTRALQLDQELKDMPDEDIPLRRARWMRQLGEAHFGLGNGGYARQLLEQTLILLGHTMPESESQVLRGLIMQSAKQAVQITTKIRPPYDEDDYPIYLEVVRTCDRLSQAYYYDNQTIRALYTSVYCLNIADRLGSSPELARVEAYMAVAMSLLPLPRLAETYAQRAEATANANDDHAALLSVLLSTTAYRFGQGQWDQGLLNLDRAIAIADEIGDRRRWNEGFAFKIPAFRTMGRFAETVSIAKELYRRGVQFQDKQMQYWGLSGQISAGLMLNDLDNVLNLLDEAVRLAEVMGQAERLWVWQQRAVAYLRSNQFEDAREAADLAAENVTNRRPTLFWGLEGYSALPEVYLRLWQYGREDDDLRKAAESVCKQINVFARIFPIGIPRARVWNGLRLWLLGKHGEAHRLWKGGLEAAVERQAVFDEGLLHSTIGQHMPEDDPARNEHIAAARDIFTRINASYELMRLNEIVG
jgi:eukaryotic-like serine/threonine-protein kinase